MQEDNPDIPGIDWIDWCYFGVRQNTDTASTPLAKQGASFRLVDAAVQVPVPAPGIIVRVTGHSENVEPFGCELPRTPNEFSGTQQTDTGPLNAHTIDVVVGVGAQVRGGASGAPFEDVCRALVYGILSGGAACGQSSGGPIYIEALQDAFACPKGVTADCNENGIADPCDVDCKLPPVL